MRYQNLTVAAACILMASVSIPSRAQEGDILASSKVAKEYKLAELYYEKGFYDKAELMFGNIAATSGDVLAEGMAVLCSARLKSQGYEERIAEYATNRSYSALLPTIYLEYARNLFDQGDYASALEKFGKAVETPSTLAEITFKKAYCCFETGLRNEALEGFAKVDAMPLNDFSAPARYAAGYACYEKADYSSAAKWFGKSVVDPRFMPYSTYYLAECRFNLADYDSLIKSADKIYASSPEERRPAVARLISESYLVKGDPQSAKLWYERVGDMGTKSAKDWFYTGSLMYASGDYRGAVDSFEKMKEYSDSLGQIAAYQMAYSYIQLKNKVSAMDLFKKASETSWDRTIQEDAHFNYAKLAFDVNKNGSVFESYLKKYPSVAKSDQIYAYIALANLYSGDYAAAVEAYDNIDELDEAMRGNYMKANYLRAEQLIGAASYRSAVPCLKAAAYYAEPRSPLGQLSNYWLAESYYRDGKYSESASAFTKLYNISALNGRDEGDKLPIDIAYAYLADGNTKEAARWFGEYVESGSKNYRKDALVRLADCSFIERNFKAAADAYEAVAKQYDDPSDIYPYYKAAVSAGLAGSASRKISLLKNVWNSPVDAPLYSEALYELGRTYADSKKNKEARECFLQVADHGKDVEYRAKSLLGLGMVERNMADYAGALSHYKEVVSTMPESSYAKDALYAIESLYHETKEPEKYLAYVDSLGDSSLLEGTDREKLVFSTAEQIYMSENYQKAQEALLNYQELYPAGKYNSQADYYLADCLDRQGFKDQACDLFLKVSQKGDESFREISTLKYAELSFSLDHFKDAYAGYERLQNIARIESNIYTSMLGMMRSAYKGRMYSEAVHASIKVASSKKCSAEEALEASLIKGKSMIASGNRKEGLEELSKLSAKPKTAEGAEAAYILIEDSYNQGKFADVESRVYAFSDSNTPQTYWLAKAFIILGDSFAEREDFAQAKATFESIAEGYKGNDDVAENVRIRLERLKTLNK